MKALYCVYIYIMYTSLYVLFWQVIHIDSAELTLPELK